MQLDNEICVTGTLDCRTVPCPYACRCTCLCATAAHCVRVFDLKAGEHALSAPLPPGPVPATCLRYKSTLSVKLRFSSVNISLSVSTDVLLPSPSGPIQSILRSRSHAHSVSLSIHCPSYCGHTLAVGFSDMAILYDLRKLQSPCRVITLPTTGHSQHIRIDETKLVVAMLVSALSG